MIAHDTWPVIPARWFKPWPSGVRPVRLIVIHTMETSLLGAIARTIAKDFATRSEDEKASSHVLVDTTEVIQSVADNDIAYCAPGANRDGLHIELAGSFKFRPEQWASEPAQAVLDRGADVTAQFCLAHDVPTVHLTDDELRAGAKGIVGHVQTAQVYRQEKHPEEHRDPGAAFPWDAFIEAVATKLGDRRARFDATGAAE